VVDEDYEDHGPPPVRLEDEHREQSSLRCFLGCQRTKNPTTSSLLVSHALASTPQPAHNKRTSAATTSDALGRETGYGVVVHA
jgi:hypothetical protein